MTETNYKDTLNLPKTDFPMKANLPEREPKQLSRWDADRIYHRIIEARASAPRYVLHDGIVVERAPHLQLAVLRHLLDVRAALASKFARPPA